MSKTSKAAKLTDDEIINLFCDAINEAGSSQAGKPKRTLFVGNQMFGKRFYSTPAAARQAVSKLAPGLTKALKGRQPTNVVAQVRNALKRKPALRKAAVDAAFNRELLYAGPPVRSALPPLIERLP